MRTGILSAALAAIAFMQPRQALSAARRVDFTSSPEGAAVVVDGTARGRTPLALFDVAPGRHHVRFSLGGHVPSDEFFKVGEGGYLSCHAELEALKGLLLLTTEPSGCAVSVNGLSLGETPRLVTTLDVNRRHRIELRKAGYQTKTIEVAFDGRTPLARHESLLLDSGTVEILSEPAGAKVMVNGIERGLAPLTVTDVARGRAKIVVSMDGFRDVVRELGVKPGDVQRLSVTMEGLPGTLRVTSVPAGARIYVDGEAQGTAPVEVAGLAAGEHLVEARLHGHYDVSRRVAVARGADVREEIWMESCLGRLEIRTEPTGVSVTVDGIRRGGTTSVIEGANRSDKMLVRDLPAGEHRVILRRRGYADFEKVVEVGAGKAVELDVRMKRVFTPDVRVDTLSGSYEGELIRETADAVVVEISPGVERTFRRSDVRSVDRIGEEDASR